jgi:uncharacterized protein
MRSGTYAQFGPCCTLRTRCISMCGALVVLTSSLFAQGTQVARNDGKVTALHQAARTGDIALLRARLQAGDNPNSRDTAGRTPLMYAVSAGKVSAERVLLASGADVNARDINGVTALIAAAEKGHSKSAVLLIHAGANVNLISRGPGTALEAAERAGHNDVVAIVRRAGARTSGKSVGDKVCVRPWGGDGYCGTVESVNKNQFSLLVTQIAGCGNNGCPAKAECSAGRPVGGPNGIKVGDLVSTVSWCLTQTGVQQ